MKPESAVSGERTVAQVVGPRSYAMRVQRTLAAALVAAMGLAVLGWYYLHMGEEARTRAASGAAGLRTAVASEMKLPLLGPRVAPPVPPPAATEPNVLVATPAVGEVPAARGGSAPHPGVKAARPPASAPQSMADLAIRAGGPVLARPVASTPAVPDAVTAALREATAAADATPAGAPQATAPGSLGDGLRPSFLKPSTAGLLPSRRWLLPKGSFLDCTLETAIDSTFPGLVTCVLATDAFGADGRVVLMERGTKLIGETRSDTHAGQARVAVLWSEARTPTGVALDLTSPGTDAQGRAGVPGDVDRHTGERFGAAVLLSVLDAALEGVANRRPAAGSIVYNASGTRDVATEVLRNTIAIPPTIRVAPGARLSVTVVRDVDFRSVYRLVPHEDP